MAIFNSFLYVYQRVSFTCHRGLIFPFGLDSQLPNTELSLVCHDTMSLGEHHKVADNMFLTMNNGDLTWEFGEIHGINHGFSLGFTGFHGVLWEQHGDLTVTNVGIMGI